MSMTGHILRQQTEMCLSESAELELEIVNLSHDHDDHVLDHLLLAVREFEEYLVRGLLVRCLSVGCLTVECLTVECLTVGCLLV